MSIYTVNYHNNFFPKPELTIILGILTYNALHHMQLELKNNALSFHSNIGGSTQHHLGLLMTNTKDATLSTTSYVRPVHPGIILIPNNTTCIVLYKLKQVYDKNIRFPHKVRGV